MLATILFILKIIGIVLLAILSLALFIILIVLFVPVRYTGYGKKEKEEGSPITAGAKATWFLKILRADYEYSENAGRLTVRVFGIRLKNREEKEEIRRLREEKKELKRRNKERSKKKPVSSKTRVEYTMTEYDDSGNVFRENTIDLKGIPVEDHPDKRSPSEDVISYGQEEDVGEKAVKPDIFERINGLFADLKGKILRIFGKIRDVIKGLLSKAKEAEYYIDALSNDTLNRQAIAFIIQKGKSLLKSIRPRKLKGFIDYGADDPADTGMVLAAAAIAYPLYSPGLKLNPDFENSVLAFDVSLKGRIYIFVPVKTFIALYFNKKVKRLIRIMKKENSNGR